MAKPKVEAVTATFHTLSRIKEAPDGTPIRLPITLAEFDDLCAKVEAKPPLSPDEILNPTFADRIRYRLEAPLELPKRVNERTLFGVFRGAYSGHAYLNTERGHIPANSISLRPFNYLIYLSKSGKLYIGAQYLGQFGAYGALERTIRDMLGTPETLVPASFRASGSYYSNIEPKEVRVNFYNRASSPSKPNTFGSTGVMTFRKQKKDDGFEQKVANRLFPLMGRPSGEVRQAVADILNESDLLEVRDEDIHDCTVVVAEKGKRGRATLHMLEGSNFATRFPLDVQLTPDGHPQYDAALVEMMSVLTEEIIRKAENV